MTIENTLTRVDVQRSRESARGKSLQQNVGVLDVNFNWAAETIVSKIINVKHSQLFLPISLLLGIFHAIIYARETYRRET